MPEPAVSVVIPSYNRAASLRRTLAAIARCRPPAGGVEVVVVDDGSTDDTGAVAQSAPIAVTLLGQDNAGPAAARNAGWRRARAPIVAFTDDDCVPGEEWLVALVAAFDAPEVAGAGGDIQPLEQSLMAEFIQLEGHVAHSVDDGGAVRYLVTANCAYRRRVLAELGGFDESFQAPSGEDTDLALRARAAGHQLVLVPEAVVHHEHRATVRQLLGTYHKHGRSRRAIVGRHHGEQWASRSRAMLGPAHWVRRFRYYRDGGCNARRAALYVALRFVGLVSYAAGMARCRLTGARGRGGTARLGGPA